MIKIDETSQVPIYQQIVDSIRYSILAGVYKPDHRLPSIRELAVKIKVNPNTIAKAYQEMANDELIYFKRGQGAYVSPRSSDDLLKEAGMEIDKKIRELFETAQNMGMSHSQVSEIFASVLKELVKSPEANSKEVK